MRRSRKVTEARIPVLKLTCPGMPFAGTDTVATIFFGPQPMKKKAKVNLPFTKKPKARYSFPVPIPPCSVISVRRERLSPWASEVGRVFRVGYYGKTDGLDCIWLVDENGKYCQTIDHDCLYKFFDVRLIAKERSLYGRERSQFPPLK